MTSCVCTGVGANKPLFYVQAAAGSADRELRSNAAGLKRSNSKVLTNLIHQHLIDRANYHKVQI